MKRILALFVLASLLLSACRTQLGGEHHVAIDEDYTVNIQTYDLSNYIEEIEMKEIEMEEIEMIEIEGIIRKIMPAGSLTIEHFLEDINYMVYVLENNFPLLCVAYWAHGVDYNELADNARKFVLAMDEPCEDTFLAIMIYHFIPLVGTGHFNIFDHHTFDRMTRNAHYGGYLGQKWRMNLQLIRSPFASRFYEPENQDRINKYEMALYGLVETYGMPSHRFWGEDIVRQPVTTKSIKENRIAYVSTGHSMEELRQGRFQISNFFTQITDYEHLIIDLRGNAGGNIDNFLDIILRPNLREIIETPNAFFFFFDGPYVRRFGDILFEPTIYNGFMTITEPYRPANEILANNILPDIRYIDIERFHYGAPAGRFEPIEPTSEGTRNAPAFGGKIWLLTDRSLGSAAQLAAFYAKETGYITLVGDITGGFFGGPRTLAFLPNTGIIFYFDIFYITDSRGRPLEAGTIPHYFNRPGLDALETVLELILETYNH